MLTTKILILNQVLERVEVCFVLVILSTEAGFQRFNFLNRCKSFLRFALRLDRALLNRVLQLAQQFVETFAAAGRNDGRRASGSCCFSSGRVWA